MNKGIVKEGILGVLKLRWHSWFTHYRKRVKNTDQPNNTPVAAGTENDVLVESK
jgi:dolichol-phosphate mannosyltransferase